MIRTNKPPEKRRLNFIKECLLSRAPLKYRLLSSFFIAAFYLSHIESLAASEDVDYRHSAGGVNAMRYSELTQINRGNLSDLKLAFTIDLSPAPFDTIQATPIKIGNLLIFVQSPSKLLAVNALTGARVWSRDFAAPIGRRGIAGNAQQLFVPTSLGVVEVDLKSGRTKRFFEGGLSLVAPVITPEDLFFVTIDGVLFRYSLLTGQMIFSKSIINGCGTARIWSGLSYSSSLKALFVSTSDPDNIGGFKPQNCLSNSIISIDSESGRINWFFQELQNDYWDLDMVGHPIVTETLHTIFPGLIDTVIAFSKTGNIFILDARTGKQRYPANSKGVEHQKSRLAAKGLEVRKDFSHLCCSINHDYLTHKLRDVKAFNYKPATTGAPVYLNGIHGGFEWPGGSVAPRRGVLVAPSNFYPFIIRNEEREWTSDGLEKLVKTLGPLKNSCAVCHGLNLDGHQSTELDKHHAGLYVPSLLLKSTARSNAWSDVGYFKFTHKFASLEADRVFSSERSFFYYEASPAWRILRRLQNDYGVAHTERLILKFYDVVRRKPDFSAILAGIDYQVLQEARKEFDQLALNVPQASGFDRFKTFWQPATDLDGKPTVPAPWGSLLAFDLEKGALKWEVPFGSEDNKGLTIQGARNFGGVLTTGSSIVIATGTADNLIHFYDLDTGSTLHSIALGRAGSAPPMTYMSKGCQLLVVVASGGRFSYFKNNGGAKAYGFKLKDCNPRM